MINRNNYRQGNKDILNKTENYEFFHAAIDDPYVNCKICKREGFPHEPITIEKVKGRVLSDGTNEVIAYKIKDYFDDKPHQHKHQRYFKGWDLEAML